MLSREDLIELQRLRCDHAALCFQVALIKYGLQLRYDDNQPRVPAGHVGAGRWTSDTAHEASHDSTSRDAEPTAPRPTPASQDEWRITQTVQRPDGSIERQIVVTPDGDTISSVFARPGEQRFDERHRVQLADGTVRIFETTQGVQKIYDGDGALLSATRWTDKGPEAVETVQQAFLIPLAPYAAQQTIVAAMSLYALMAMNNGPSRQAVFAFRSDAFAANSDENRPVAWIGSLTREEVDQSCPRHREVQALTNTAALSVVGRSFKNPGAYGTAVHQALKEMINGPDTKRPPPDPNFRAEVSLIKSEAARYGKPGSIRVDVLENVGNGTVCAYDIKTGEAILAPGRSAEIADNVKKYYGSKFIIVTEVRPGR